MQKPLLTQFWGTCPRRGRVPQNWAKNSAEALIGLILHFPILSSEHFLTHFMHTFTLSSRCQPSPIMLDSLVLGVLAIGILGSPVSAQPMAQPMTQPMAQPFILVQTPVLTQTSVPLPSPLPSSTPNSSRAIQTQGTAIFESLTLSPDFTPDPVTIRGISGGDTLATELTGRTDTATGACVGFIDRQADHTVRLTQAFTFLRLQVQSSEDTTLVVRGPGGTWCNDDYTDKNPGIAGQWLSGIYQIWIGSYGENEYHPYVIRLTQQQE